MRKFIAGVFVPVILAATAGFVSADEKGYQNPVGISFEGGVNVSRDGDARAVLKPQINVGLPLNSRLDFGAKVYPGVGMGNSIVQPYVSLETDIYNSSNFSVGSEIGAEGLVAGMPDGYSGSFISGRPQVILGAQFSFHPHAPSYKGKPGKVLPYDLTAEVSASVSSSGLEGITFTVGARN